MNAQHLRVRQIRHVRANCCDHGFDISFVRADVNVLHNVADWCNTVLIFMYFHISLTSTGLVHRNRLNFR